MSISTLRAHEFAWMNKGDIVYMNAASTGPTPQRSVDAQIDFVRRRSAPHEVDYDAQFGTLARCRALVAEMIHSSVDEIALAANTGAGINLAAWGLSLGPGDEVILSDAEFPANMYPWLAAGAVRGFAVHVVPARDGLLDEDALIAALDRPGVKVLAASWVGFSTGYVMDLDRVGAACRAAGVTFVVDAIQGLGPLTIDVSQVPVDLLACGGQKWLLSPWGTGFTYVRKELVESIAPQPVSWMAVRGADDFSRLVDYDLTWRQGARRFEQVTLPYQDFAGMAASLELLRDVGFSVVSERCVARAQELSVAARALGMSVAAPMNRSAGIASLLPSDARLVSKALSEAGVIHSLREQSIRLAPHCYTAESDIKRVVRILETVA